MELSLDLAWNIFNDFSEGEKKDIFDFINCLFSFSLVFFNTCDTHQAVAPCLMNTAAWCQSWPSRLQPSAKIQQIHRPCAWSRSQGECQQQPCPAPFYFFHQFLARDVWCLRVVSEPIDGYKRRACKWSRIDYWSDCSSSSAECLANFLCLCCHLVEDAGLTLILNLVLLNPTTSCKIAGHTFFFSYSIFINNQSWWDFFLMFSKQMCLFCFSETFWWGVTGPSQ